MPIINEEGYLEKTTRKTGSIKKNTSVKNDVWLVKAVGDKSCGVKIGTIRMPLKKLGKRVRVKIEQVRDTR